MKSNGKELKYIRVRKADRTYRIWLSDLKGIYMQKRRNKMPRVPAFDPPFHQESEQMVC